VDPAIGHDLQALVDELDDEAAAAQIELDYLQENRSDRGREQALLARYGRTLRSTTRRRRSEHSSRASQTETATPWAQQSRT
jgi:hypothetical protein